MSLNAIVLGSWYVPLMHLSLRKRERCGNGDKNLLDFYFVLISALLCFDLAGIVATADYMRAFDNVEFSLVGKRERK